MIVKANVGREFGWPIDAKELQDAHAVLAELQIANDPLVLSQSAEAETPSLSLADRFETILESGRKIATGLTESVIYEATCAAASRLLRVQHGAVLRVSLEDPPEHWPLVAGRLGWEINPSLLRESVAACRAIAKTGGNGASREPSSQVKANSELSVPLFMRGKPVACLYVMHSEIRGLFGVDEERLADFLATIAGAALENAEGFAELQELNSSLERRVAERTAAVETRSRELAASNKELERIAQELRQAQVQLSASKQAAEAASEAKSRFLATMSHEIRTPMNGILGMAELVLSSHLSDRQRGYLETLKDSGNALLTLLNDLLDISKIEAGKMELEAIPFSVRDVVVDSARLLAVPASRKGLNLITRIEPIVPTQVIGDPNRLRQVLVNLLGNAIKFTPQGEVTVHVRLQSHSHEESLLRISVRDTGIGIPEHKQQFIFEAFHQTDSSVNRRFGGTGLGLAISLQLVQLMDGTIQVESHEGQGTAFHVDVPFTLADDPSEEQNLESPKRGVLLLSDHPESELAARDTLAHLGIEAQTDPARFSRRRRPLLIVDFSVQSHSLISAVAQRIFNGQNDPEDLICLVPGGCAQLMQECGRWTSSKS
jgi:two-component system sensor kinase